MNFLYLTQESKAGSEAQVVWPHSACHVVSAMGGGGGTEAMSPTCYGPEHSLPRRSALDRPAALCSGFCELRPAGFTLKDAGSGMKHQVCAPGISES